MQFNEPTFLLLFLPILLLAYYALPPLRNLLLLGASLVFCLWGGKQTVGVLLLALAVNYGLGLLVAKRRWLLIAGVTVNLLLLVWCKYADFLGLSTLVSVWCKDLVRLGWPTVGKSVDHLALFLKSSPPGLSYFTFVAIAYLVDIYRGEAQPLRSPLAAGNYFLFFPKLLAGPIVRYRDIGGQMLQRDHRRELFATGVRRFIIGLGKKVLVATTVGGVADKVFALPVEALRADLAWLGVVAYTVQIYFDFSGYTDMAVGLGAMFGFKLPENFNYPYVSTSIREFWRRWHMTLSGWLRDYLYIPLGGSRCPVWRTYFNLVLVFFLCGLWHGANWTYIVWGLIQGCFLLLERVTGNKDLPRPVGQAYALVVTMISWVFFRATSLTQATGFLAAMFGLNRATGVADGVAAYLDPFTVLMLAIGIIGSFPILPRLKTREPLASVGYVFVLFVVLVIVAVKTYIPFIYQQF